MRFIPNLAVGVIILAAALLTGAIVPVHSASDAGRASIFSTSSSSIIVNEIMYDPLGTELDGEWVELFNNGTQPVNVLNWTLSDQDGSVDYTFPDIVFPAGGYALVHTGRGQNSTIFVNGKAEFFMWKTSSMWSPTADDCLLSNATGTTMDYISYGLWNGSGLDAPPPDFNYTHSNASAREGFTLALLAGALRESVPTALEFNGRDIAPELLITEVYYDTWGENEYVKIHNPGLMPVNISHWLLTDGEGIATFPTGMEINPGQTLAIAQNSTNFIAGLLEAPDLEYSPGDAAIPDLEIIGSPPRLVNDGDEVFLENIFGSQVDAFVYGDSGYNGTGWAGAPAPDLKQGRFAKRAYNGTFADTNTSADWLSPRPHVIGQSDFQSATFTGVGPMRVFSSPDSSFDAVSEALDNATQYIWLNLYEFTNTRVCDRLLDAMSRGVGVRLFIEGSPVGGMNETQMFIMRRISEAGGFVRILTNDPDNGIHARYDYDHGKYAVIDDNVLVIMSENWGWTGVPPPGWYGNRGWGAVIHDASVAGYFKSVFEHDWNPQNADSVLFAPSHSDWDSGHNWSRDGSVCKKHFPSSFITSPSSITPVLSPDTALSNQTIIGMLNSARNRVYVEEFYIYKHWGDRKNGSTTDTPNIYLEAVIAAARRGCQVRILMDASDYNVEPDDPIDNDDTAAYVNGMALAENLDMEAKVVNLTEHDFVKIHNKGLIADDSVLISSINWNLNSATENRETGIIIENKQASEFFTGIFGYDWMDDTTPPRPHFTFNSSYPVNSTLHFSANKSYDNVGIVNYTWLLDGKSISWVENLTLNFNDTGSHTLNLTASDAWGNTGYVIHAFNITANPPGNPNGTAVQNPDDAGSMDRAVAVMLLVPVFIFIAVVYLIRMRNR